MKEKKIRKKKHTHNLNLISKVILQCFHWRITFQKKCGVQTLATNSFYL